MTPQLFNIRPPSSVLPGTLDDLTEKEGMRCIRPVKATKNAFGRGRNVMKGKVSFSSDNGVGHFPCEDLYFRRDPIVLSCVNDLPISDLPGDARSEDVSAP